jgi:SAM-dependent methyltransferase
MLVFERRMDATVWPIVFFLAALFAICMFAHGELARSRPEPQRLTRFYLAVSAGGVAGGALVALAAPALLPGYFEVELGLVAVAAALLWRCWPDGPAWRAAAALLVVGAAATAAWRVHDALRQVIAIDRNFYGVLRVREYGGGDPEALERVLVHGRIMHGQQFLAETRRRQPTSYYAERSGIGRLLQALADRPIEVAAIGLGVGTIATYGKPGDRYRFYEIDPAVPPAAREHFTYLADSPAQIEIAVGDGRLLLQAEGERRFDVIVVDAFSGDAIPAHLLTREAVQLYLQRLKPGGVIALHLSNTYLDLRGVAAGIAAELGLQAAWIGDPGGGESDPSRSSSDWVLLARERELFDAPPIAEAAAPLPPADGLRTWTDDYSHIVGVMKIGRAPAAE